MDLLEYSCKGEPSIYGPRKRSCKLTLTVEHPLLYCTKVGWLAISYVHEQIFIHMLLIIFNVVLHSQTDFSFMTVWEIKTLTRLFKGDQSLKQCIPTVSSLSLQCLKHKANWQRLITQATKNAQTSHYMGYLAQLCQLF